MTRLNWEKERSKIKMRSLGPDPNSIRMYSSVGVVDKVLRKVNKVTNCAVCRSDEPPGYNMYFWIRKNKYTHKECGMPLD